MSKNHASQRQKGIIVMTREEFMKDARLSVHKMLEGKENGIMNLVHQAWAEGKRNAEVETLKQTVVEAFTSGTATIAIGRPCEVGCEDNIPNNDEDCVLLYKGQKIKCKMFQVEYADPAWPMATKRVYKVCEV